MSTTHPGGRTRTERHRPSPASRRVGYAVSLLVSSAFYYAANGTPGWQAVPFLTEDTAEVMPEVNAAIVAGLLANAVFLVHDPPWLRAVGDMMTTVVGVVALVEVWQVFPVDFTDDVWATVARWVVAIGLVGSFIAILAAFGALVRAVGDRHTPLLPQ